MFLSRWGFIIIQTEPACLKMVATTSKGVRSKVFFGVENIPPKKNDEKEDELARVESLVHML